MRYPADHAAATRTRLLDLAADTIRVQGVAALGVAPLMRAAGLTNGGFYQHFASRDALIEATIDHMFARSRDGIAVGEGGARHRLARFLKGYLSAAHAADPAGGCPLPSLAGEAARLPVSARARYRAGLERILERVATLLREAACDAPPSSVVAELVGAVALARLAPDAHARDAVLAASRAALSARLGLSAMPAGARQISPPRA